MKNKGFWIAFAVMALSFVLDLVSTLRAKGNLELLETNPIFRLTGSLLIPIVTNLAFMGVMIWMYHSNKTYDTTRFILINMMITIALLRCIIIIPNNLVMVDTAQNMTTEQIQSIATPHAMAITYYMTALDIYLPFIAGILSIFLFKMDHWIIKKYGEDTIWRAKKSIVDIKKIKKVCLRTTSKRS